VVLGVVPRVVHHAVSLNIASHAFRIVHRRFLMLYRTCVSRICTVGMLSPASWRVKEVEMSFGREAGNAKLFSRGLNSLEPNKSLLAADLPEIFAKPKDRGLNRG